MSGEQTPGGRPAEQQIPEPQSPEQQAAERQVPERQVPEHRLRRALPPEVPAQGSEQEWKGRSRPPAGAGPERAERGGTVGSGTGERTRPGPGPGAAPVQGTKAAPESTARRDGAQPAGTATADGAIKAAEAGDAAGTARVTGTARTTGTLDAPGTARAAGTTRVEGSPDAAGSAAATGSAATGSGVTGRQRLVRALWPPSVSRAQLIVAVLLFGLGFGLAIQVASTSDNSALRGARQEDLVRILDELGDRTQRLQEEKQSLEHQRTELENSSDQAEEARRQTEEKERQLGILAGTVAAQGPGITLTIDDIKGTVEADMLLDTIQELRAAGAEAIQVNDVRIVVNSYVTDVDDGISVDGHKIGKPYRFKVIGKPEDLEPALNIPGGVVQTLEKERAVATVQRSQSVVVDALRPAKRPDYSQSSSR